ncbi:MAG: ABC transporter ATP-binding protein, partial [Holophagaceae bacterium]
MSRLLRFFNDHLRTHVPLIAGASVLLLLAGLCQGALIASIKFVFDDGKARSLHMVQPGLFGQLETLRAWTLARLPEASALRNGLLVPLVLVCIFALKGLLTYSGTLLMVKSGIRATQALRERLFAHFLAQEPAFFQKHPVGELLTRSISDVGAVQGIASNQLAEAVREICVAITMLITVLFMDWQLSLTLFLAGPLVVFPIKRLSQRIRRVNHRNQEASSRLLQRLKEVFSNIRVVQAFAREPYEVERFRERNRELYQLGMKSARASALSTPIMELVGGLLLAGLAAYASGRFKAGTLTTENFLTYILGIYALYDPLRRLTKLNNEVQVASASLDRVYAMLDRKSELPVNPSPQPVPARPASLRFEDVSFAYEAKHPVLRSIDLEVRSGETVALVGGSGG